jgi:gliding motility-associated-like protein
VVLKLDTALNIVDKKSYRFVYNNATNIVGGGFLLFQNSRVKKIGDLFWKSNYPKLNAIQNRNVNAFSMYAYDKDLNIRKSVFLKINKKRSNVRGLDFKQDGTGFLSFTEFATRSQYYALFDTSGRIFAQRKMTSPQFSQINKFRNGSFLGTELANHTTLLGTQYQNANGRTEAEFYNLTNRFFGDTGTCFGVDTNFVTSENVIAEPDFNDIIYEENTGASSQPANLQIADFPLTINSTCKQVQICDSLKIISNIDTVTCLSNQIYQFKASKNPTCRGQFQWQIDTTGLNLTRINDSTINLQFRQSWQGYLRVKLDACNQLKDSMRIQVFTPKPPVRLGADTTVCVGNTIQLNARAGYRKYLWQNGSSDSLLIVNSTGTYWVSVLDSCLQKSRDSIFVQVNNPKLFVASDTTICQNDSVFLQATGGLQNYVWSPTQDLTLLGNTKVVVYPRNTITYQVEAVDSSRCIAKSSIKIEVIICNINMYFPTGFTPNKDGRNDFYKPTGYGKLKFYQFRIINRWGQNVFSTNNVKAGWDGRINGVEQDAGLFSWVCSYEFEVGGLQKEKGTFLLIR